VLRELGPDEWGKLAREAAKLSIPDFIDKVITYWQNANKDSHNVTFVNFSHIIKPHLP